MKQAAALRTVVLAGGGHAHALLLREWARDLPPDLRLLVVSPAPLTPYSGMLPGYLAGHYRHEEMHIDLARLCQRAGALLINDCVTGLDAATRTLRLADNPPLRYDLLSLDTGATPAPQIPGVAEFAVPVKPIAGFIALWHALRDVLRNSPAQQHLVSVGGGAGSVELALALSHATRSDPLLPHKPRFTLVTRDAALLPGYPRRVVATATEHCKQQGVTIVTNFAVEEVRANNLHDTAGGAVQHFDHLFWCTEAAAPAWLQHSGLALSERGFVRVNTALEKPHRPTLHGAVSVTQTKLTQGQLLVDTRRLHQWRFKTYLRGRESEHFSGTSDAMNGIRALHGWIHGRVPEKCSGSRPGTEGVID